MRNPYRKIVALGMLVVLTVVTLASFARNGCAFQQASTFTKAHSVLAAQLDADCPECPLDQHSDSGHCGSACYCACHAPLMAQPVQLVCARLLTPLLFHESVKYPPEVYLSKFVPPEILA